MKQQNELIQSGLFVWNTLKELLLQHEYSRLCQREEPVGKRDRQACETNNPMEHQAYL